MFSFWQLTSIFLSRNGIFLEKLWGIWEIANLIGNKASILPAPSEKRKEKKPSDALRGSWSLAGRWEQNKWLQGNLPAEHTGEKLIYTPGHKSLYPFQKAFCFAFPTASFLPSNCLCTCPSPVRVLRPSGFSSFPLLLPVHRHRSSQGWVNPALSHFIPLAPWATQHTLCHNNVPPVPTACLSPASLLPLQQKSNFQNPLSPHTSILSVNF